VVHKNEITDDASDGDFSGKHFTSFLDILNHWRIEGQSLAGYMEHELVTGVLETEPLARSRGRAPRQGIRGRRSPETERLFHNHNPRSRPICPKICFCKTENVVGHLGRDRPHCPLDPRAVHGCFIGFLCSMVFSARRKTHDTAVAILSVHLSVTLVIHVQAVQYNGNMLCIAQESDVSSFRAIFADSLFRSSPRTRDLNRDTPCKQRYFEPTTPW